MLTSTIAFAAVLAMGVSAQNFTSTATTATITSRTRSASGEVSAQTTITALVGSMASGFAGRILDANACSTTMALSCADDSFLCSAASGIELTVTQGPGIYEVAYATSTLGGEVTISQSCDLDGPSESFTQAVCTYSFMVSAGGVQTATSSSTTVSGTQYDFQYAQVPITAGAEKLPSGPATCTETASPGAAAPTGGIRKEIYKVIVPVGAVLAAGALL